MQLADDVRIHELSLHRVMNHTNIRLKKEKGSFNNPKQENSLPLSDLAVSQENNAEVKTLETRKVKF